MEKEFERLLEIRNQKGEVIWSVWLSSSQAEEIRGTIAKSGNGGNQTEHRKEEGQNSGGSNDDPMTDAQKRYLFRLLAKKGIEGDAAYKHLMQTFGVDSVKKITKVDASQAIDRMLNA